MTPEREKESEAQLVERAAGILEVRLGTVPAHAEDAAEAILAAARPLIEAPYETALQKREQAIAEQFKTEQAMRREEREKVLWEQIAWVERVYRHDQGTVNYLNEHTRNFAHQTYNIDLTSQEGE